MSSHLNSQNSVAKVHNPALSLTAALGNLKLLLCIGGWDSRASPLHTSTLLPPVSEKGRNARPMGALNTQKPESKLNLIKPESMIMIF